MRAWRQTAFALVLAAACGQGTVSDAVDAADEGSACRDDDPCIVKAMVGGVCGTQPAPEGTPCAGGTCLAGVCTAPGAADAGAAADGGRPPDADAGADAGEARGPDAGETQGSDAGETQGPDAGTATLFAHRSWIKLGLVAYQRSMTQAQLDWTAAHFDWFDSPSSQYLPQYKALSSAPMIKYDTYPSVYVGEPKYTALVSYFAARNVPLEQAFLHYAEPTTVTYSSETHTLPAGSRVPNYGWYGTGGDMTATGARIAINPGSATFRAFNAEHQQATLAKTYSGVTYDGIFADNCSPGFMFKTLGTISTGGTIVEYPGDATTRAENYDADMVKVFAEVHAAVAPKIQVPNGAVRAWGKVWVELFPYVGGSFMEHGLGPEARTDASHYQTTIANFLLAHEAGIPLIISSSGTGTTSTDAPEAKMTTLALYYLAATPSSYFCRQDSTSGDPQTMAWFPALEYDVGRPVAAYSVLAHGKDPSDGVALYDVLARMYERVLVVSKGLTTNGNTGASTNTTHPLPTSSDNPTGVYHRLNVDGSVDPAPLTQITLGNAEGAILVKATAP